MDLQDYKDGKIVLTNNSNYQYVEGKEVLGEYPSVASLVHAHPVDEKKADKQDAKKDSKEEKGSKESVSKSSK